MSIQIPKRVLMVKSHSLGIGDLLRSSAAWRALHNRFPGIELHLVFLSKHSGYPTEALIQQHHLLASAEFLTIREGHPGEANARRVPLSDVARQIQALARRIEPDWVIDFESSGLRTSWLARKAAKACHARSLGIAQFPGRSLFYDMTSPSTKAYKLQHNLPAQMDYSERDFVALAAWGIEREGMPIELSVTQAGLTYKEKLKNQLPLGRRVIGLNIGCGTEDALAKRPPLGPLAQAVNQVARLSKFSCSDWRTQRTHSQ